MARAPYTAFGVTRNVKVTTYTDGRIDKTPKTYWHKELWIERAEDWYALLNPAYRDSVVRVVERRDWLFACWEDNDFGEI